MCAFQASINPIDVIVFLCFLAWNTLLRINHFIYKQLNIFYGSYLINKYNLYYLH